jgi:hypothetical protein
MVLVMMNDEGLKSPDQIKTFLNGLGNNAKQRKILFQIYLENDILSWGSAPNPGIFIDVIQKFVS